MVKQLRAKQERIIESVRHGLEGEAAMEFIHRSGYAMTQGALARHLHAMGGKKHIQDLLAQGKSNVEILETCFPSEDLHRMETAPPDQGELFVPDEPVMNPFLADVQHPLFESTKLTVTMPTDLYQALSLAAKAEGKRRNDLIVEILTTALSRLPAMHAPEKE
ncbi:MAG TPA: hypothetical protein PLI09_28875 [Candidatus Hydrogenedentes bacterium]|nr:hypothetical protein [Candidatus Hydrogenedentota bacterium]